MCGRGGRAWCFWSETIHTSPSEIYTYICMVPHLSVISKCYSSYTIRTCCALAMQPGLSSITETVVKGDKRLCGISCDCSAPHSRSNPPSLPQRPAVNRHRPVKWPQCHRHTHRSHCTVLTGDVIFQHRYVQKFSSRLQTDGIVESENNGKKLRWNN